MSRSANLLDAGGQVSDRLFVDRPLEWLDRAARDGRGVRWMSRRELCVYDADVGRSLLRNEDGRLVEHSDFFGNGRTALSPRDVQISLAREVHALVQRQVRAADFERFALRLGSCSEWPTAGNALLLEIMRPILASRRRSPRFHKALDRLVAAKILNRHASPPGYLLRIRDRFRFYRAVSAEAAGIMDAADADDLLGVIVKSKSGMSEETLVHLYAAFVFATVGSIGFALGWAVLLTIRHLKIEHHPTHLVMEALRLYPVAWLLQRRMHREDEILGERVAPSQAVTISPYAVHRNPVYWDDPTMFLPERWLGRTDRRAWLPFGAGDHSCVAASLTVDTVGALLAAILRYPARIEQGDGPPSIGAALAAPRFLLKLDISS